MKRISFFFLIVLLWNAGPLQAQNKAEKQVAVAVEKLRLGMIDANEPALNKLVMEELSYGHSSGKVETKTEFIKALSSGNSDFKTIEFSNQVVRVVGKTALVRHLLTARTNDKGVPDSVKLTILLVWQKQHREWRLLARQAIKA
ncbi:nuclear transport factor 2 family protein [Adhaeribacter aquaticus]|uniref:nuclear transport factor 2 family protein n=1 Tax=Adhaeribacter aquaticus TaxID=299567 RepID=UPI0003F80D37|nr:nuclear transport factor 2 family protein [Adhaeribacter aquaticus]